MRVLVVDDSVTVRKRLIEVLAADPDLEVTGEAADGREAIERCRELRPSVVTLDLALPVLSGLAVTEYIMAYFPTPIVIVSASCNRAGLYATYEALAAGAVDVLDKPTGVEADDEWARRLVAVVKVASRVRVITHLRGRLRPAQAPEERAGEAGASAARVPAADGASAQAGRVVAIGASTGGPRALVEILQGLGRDFPLPILVAVHLGEGFGAAFAEWLAGPSPLPVANAVNGQPLPPAGRGQVVLAPPGRHLVLDGGVLRLTADPERHSCRPSVDVLFESIARAQARRSLCCLLTGMGRDGAAGLLAVREAGGRTLAQDEATSTVFGMPAEAIRLGAAERIIGLHEVAPALAAFAGGGGRPGGAEARGGRGADPAARRA